MSGRKDEKGNGEMKLIFANMQLTPNFERFGQFIFNIASSELGISDSLVNILFLVDQSIEALLGTPTEDGGFMSRGGRTDDDIRDGFIRVEIAANNNLKMMADSFFHEMVHVRQIVTGQLSVKDEKTTIWQGKPYHYDRTKKESSSEGYQNYLDLPWEAEARKEGARLLAIAESRISEIADIVKDVPTKHRHKAASTFYADYFEWRA
jgi:hypothetical protein